jgi:hypothetical protein
MSYHNIIDFKAFKVVACLVKECSESTLVVSNCTPLRRGGARVSSVECRVSSGGVLGAPSAESTLGGLRCPLEDEDKLERKQGCCLTEPWTDCHGDSDVIVRVES